MDQEKRNTILFKVRDNKLVKMSDKQKSKFFFSESNLLDPNLCISITYEDKDNDIGLYFWHGYYSIGITYKEFMAIYDRLKDKETLINEIVAKKV